MKTLTAHQLSKSMGITETNLAHLVHIGVLPGTMGKGKLTLDARKINKWVLNVEHSVEDKLNGYYVPKTHADKEKEKQTQTAWGRFLYNMRQVGI